MKHDAGRPVPDTHTMFELGLLTQKGTTTTDSKVVAAGESLAPAPQPTGGYTRLKYTVSSVKLWAGYVQWI